MSAEPDLDSAARSVLDAALSAGATDAETWAESSRGREVRVHGGEVETLTTAGERGVGVRAWVETRAGYAYGTDFADAALRVLAVAAVEAARVADEDEFAGPAEGGDAAAVPGIRDAAIGEWDTAAVVDLAKRIERTALDADERVVAVEQAVYVDADGRVALATSRGAGGTYEASQCYAYLQALAGGDGERQTGLGFGVGRSPAALDPDAIGREAAGEAVAMLGASKPDSRTCPVLFADTVAASFVSFIGGALCADAVQRGRSPFAGRLGDELASPAVALADDGLVPDGLASAPFDGEGTPRRRTELVTGGRLAAYLHDGYTARREGGGASSTGNAARGSYRSAPSVSTSNLIVGTGESSLDDLVGEAGEGVYVTDVAGLHSGVNPVSGTFSVGAAGRLIGGGELSDPVREFTIASDLVAMLSAVAAAGSESRWVPFGGSVRTPPLLISEMTVSGT